MAERRMTERAAVAAFHLAVIQLLECAGFRDSDPLTDVAVAFDGRSMRIDIARLSEDGLRVGEWLRGYTVDPRDLATFGTPVGLPGTDGQTH
jgi:hypothetical protein